MDTLATRQHEQFETFCNFLDEQRLWAADISKCHSSMARLAIDYSFDEAETSHYGILARRHQEGQPNRALKICFWREDSRLGLFIGAIGYHHPSAYPYHKAPGPEFDTASLYTIMAASMDP